MRYALVVASAGPPVETSSAACPCPENLALISSFHSNPISSEPSPIHTITPEGKFASLYCNMPANRASADGHGKSLIMKTQEENAQRRQFHHLYVRHDLGVPSNARHTGPPQRLPPRAVRSQGTPFPLKTGRLADPPAKAFHWTHRCFIALRRNGDRY